MLVHHGIDASDLPCIAGTHSYTWVERANEEIAFTPPSEQGLVIPIFVLGFLPQTSGFRLAKQIFAVSFTAQARARILSGHNNILHPEGRVNNGRV